MKALKWKDIIKELRARGWTPVRSKGSHQQWKSPDGKQTFTTVINHTGKDASPNVVRNFNRQVIGQKGSGKPPKRKKGKR
jgi:predicted RNA binding protein YcfA (HicA-like mRNA interferase family)